MVHAHKSSVQSALDNMIKQSTQARAELPDDLTKENIIIFTNN